MKKKNVQPDIFLKPISEAEAVSDIPENENLLVTYQKMKTFYLFVSSPMLSTLDYRAHRSFKETYF